MATCSTCGAEILWVKMTTGTNMPLDAKPDPQGAIVVEGMWAAHLRSCAMPLPKSAQRYTSHFATCPQAKQHRKAK